MSREDKIERQALLRASGETELRRLDAVYPGRTFPRTLNQAFPSESWRGVVTHHRAPLLHRVWHWVAQIVFVALLFGGAGVLGFLYLAR